MSKPLVFISYAHEDEEIAVRIRDWIREVLLDGLDFFVAGDQGSIPLGSFWPAEIAMALRGCSAALLVLSPGSLGRNWLHFEAGAAFGRDVPVIPLCCGGLDKAALTPPISFLQAAQLPGEADEIYLLAELARLCRLRAPQNYLRLNLAATSTTPPPGPPAEEQKLDVMSILFEEKRLSRLVLEWRDKILEKIQSLEA